MDALTVATSIAELKCYRCNQTIQFNPEVKGKNGRLIPLNIDSTKHQCPNFVPASQIKPLACNRCGQPIKFDKNIVSKNGKRIPLNQDGSNHDCPNSDYNKKRNSK